MLRTGPSLTSPRSARRCPSSYCSALAPSRKPRDLGARAGDQGRLRQGAGPDPGRARAARRGVRSDSSCLDPSVDHPCTLHCPCRSASVEPAPLPRSVESDASWSRSLPHGFQTPELRALSALCSSRWRCNPTRAVRITALVADARRTRRGDDARHILEAPCVLRHGSPPSLTARAVQEGAFLYDRGLDPYTGDIFSQVCRKRRGMR